MANTMRHIFVDFYGLTHDDDVQLGPIRISENALDRRPTAPGERVVFEDTDGNRCQGTCIAPPGHFRLDVATWRDAPKPPRTRARIEASVLAGVRALRDVARAYERYVLEHGGSGVEVEDALLEEREQHIEALVGLTDEWERVTP